MSGADKVYILKSRDASKVAHKVVFSFGVYQRAT